jgi:rod shape-determining protein MreB and related proteins
MFRLFRTNLLYVRIRRDAFDIRNIDTDQRNIARSLSGFSSERLLIANFSEAESTLLSGIRELPQPGRSVAWRACILFHPLELVDGGISQVEDRVLRELAAAAGASRCAICTGPDLTDGQVRDRLSAL